MSRALYRTYRSKKLDEVVGQKHVTDILSRALKEDKIAHAYLLTGPRGVGKTSVARILAHEINHLPYIEEEQHLDIIEIDAASNNGVEDIRDLRERVRLAPTSAAKKVYIIDEVHMLSKPAFNALLKTLEEPPEHVVFILATTDANKLPATIISRTQRFNFRTVSTDEVAAHLGWIAKQEGFLVDDEALRLIAAHGEGSFRDSISLLDQLQSLVGKKDTVSGKLVEEFLGLPPAELVEKLLAAFEAKNLAEVVALLDEADTTGIEASLLSAELVRAVRANITTRPQLLPLLNTLIDVASSSRPDIKLLIALTSHMPEKAKSAALSSKLPTLSLPITPVVVAPEPATAPTPKAQTKTAVASQAFEWEVLLHHIKAHHMALSTVLTKCSYALTDDTLTIYAGNSFYKKKLEDARHRVALASAIADLGMPDLTIEIVAESAPPKDKIAAAVAAIMGGGEEIALEEAGNAA